MLRPSCAALACLALTLLLQPWPGVALAHPFVHERVTQLDELIETQPTAGLHLQRAEAHRQSGHLEKAREDLERARSLDARAAGLELARAAIELDAEDFSAAIHYSSRHLAAQPEDGNGYLLRARARARLGRAAEAVSDFDGAIRHIRRLSPEHFLERFRIQCSLDEYEEALAGLAQGTRELGSVVALERAALDLELQRNDYEAAIARLDQMQSTMGNSAQWHEWRADALRRAGREMEALAAYSQALIAIETMPAGRRLAPASRALEQRLRQALRHEEAVR